MAIKVKADIGGRDLIIETGKIAKQASGSVTVTYGDTIVLGTAVREDSIREGIDFLPLTVDYQEMAYAAGRIPGNFFRREMGRPSEKETLTSRCIDRPLRPRFPKGYNSRDCCDPCMTAIAGCRIHRRSSPGNNRICPNC